MAQRRLLVGRVLALAWRKPDEQDFTDIVSDLREAHGRLGKRLLYLSVIGRKSIPEGRVRDELATFYRDVLTYCDSMHVVIEGSEFELSIKRSVIANVLLVVKARGRIFIENTLESLRAASPQEVRAELSEAIAVARGQKLFEYAKE